MRKTLQTAIVEQTTEAFRDDWERLDAADRKRVGDTLNRAYDLPREDRRRFFAKVYRPLPVRLKGGPGSSLYCFRVDRGIRLVLSVVK